MKSRSRLAALALAMTACSPVDVFVATADAALDGPPPRPLMEGGRGQSCATNDDCVDLAYCSMASCGERRGTCQLRPLSCDSTFAAVCGCDGVVYWNDCLRQRDGVAAGTEGECTGAAPYVICGGEHDIPCPSPDAVCAQYALGQGGHPGQPDQCRPQSPGACWVLPDSCPDGGPREWRLCDAPHGCTTLCAAIASGHAYRVGPMCH